MRPGLLFVLLMLCLPSGAVCELPPREELEVWDPSAPKPPKSKSPIIVDRGQKAETGFGLTDKPFPMTAAEKKRFAKDLESLSKKREQEQPQQMAKELNKMLERMMNDPNFLMDALREAQASPEYQMVMREMDAQMEREMREMLSLLQAGFGNSPNLSRHMLMMQKEFDQAMKAMRSMHGDNRRP